MQHFWALLRVRKETEESQLLFEATVLARVYPGPDRFCLRQFAGLVEVEQWAKGQVQPACLPPYDPLDGKPLLLTVA